MPLVFSYGSLQRADVQLATFGRTLAARPDALRGYERGTSRCGKHANLVRVAGAGVVAGTVLELSDSELAAADLYERAEGYARGEVTLESGTSAWLYTETQEANAR